MSRSNEHSAVWLTPAIAILGGVAFLISASLGGHPAAGVGMFAVMVVFAAVILLVARRSETVKGLLDHRDERIASIDLKATATTGALTLVIILIGAAVELARGHSGAPYTWLAAFGGLTYVVSVVVLRLRS